MKKLVIIESPGKLKKISSILGPDYTILPTVGHIVELAKGGRHGIGIDFENNYKLKYMLMEDKVKVLSNIIEAAKDHDEIILLCDPDREGISISWHIKERLIGFDKPIRATATDQITKEGLKKAFSQLGDINLNIVRAQEARRALDRIVGFMASPFLMKVKNKALSAGRVQSVAVRLIVDKEKEISNFNPETYFTIDLNLNKGIDFRAVYPKKLKDEKEANRINNLLLNEDYIVDNIKDDIELKNPSAPLITSTLQQVMSTIHGFEPARTMKAAQGLYEGGYVTYIRTDSPDISKEALDDVRDYLKNNNHKIPKNPNKYKSKDSAQEAHECIRPTNLNSKLDDGYSDVDEDQKKVYDVIWKYFVASQCEPAKFSTRKVIFKSNTSNIEVKSSGKCLVEANYLDILGQKDNSKIDIPELKVGEVVKLSSNNPTILEKKKTKPPARFNIASLVKNLEDNEIGRPSTYAEIISKIESREYVERKGNVYYPTELGINITNTLTESFSFMDYNFTATIEKDLDLIAEGKMTYLEMMNKFYPSFKKELTEAYKKENVELCKKCESPLVTSKDGNSTFCSNYRKCK